VRSTTLPAGTPTTPVTQTGPQQVLTPTAVRLAEPGPGHRSAGKKGRYGRKITVAAVAALACAATAVVCARAAQSESGRKATPAELQAAAATGAEQRWERVSAGTLFPARFGYTTSLLTQESGNRIGIAPPDDCMSALDPTLRSLAGHFHCRRVLRASYADALGGTVYTVGVLVFPTPAQADGFYSRMPAPAFPATGLNTLPLAGTASARFSDAARQSSLAREAGSYVVLVVGGYADGRPAAADGERRPPVFAPAAQLAATVIRPLTAPSVVNCQDKAEWAC
jgi:hypothetical protein